MTGKVLDVKLLIPKYSQPVQVQDLIISNFLRCCCVLSFVWLCFVVVFYCWLWADIWSLGHPFLLLYLCFFQGMNLIESLDTKGFYSYLDRYANTICGRHPIGILLNVRLHCQCWFYFEMEIPMISLFH